MINHMKVITTNELITKDGGYHEIHDIKYLNSPEHALVTVINIIENNMKFTDVNCPLVGVDVSCKNYDTYILISNHFEDMKDIWVRFG